MQPDDMVELLRHRGLEIDLTDNTLRKKIAARFGLTVPVFTSWIAVVTLTRNACCHHARVWNKENAISPMIPRRLSDRWIVSNVSPKRIYYNICIIRWFIDIAPFVFSEIPPVSNRLALESLLKEMSYSSILVINLLFVYPSQYNVIDSAI